MKEKFIKSAIILMIGGAITKFLGMFIRIIMTRLVGLEGIGLYMLIYPTFSLFMTLSQLSMPIAISKLVSEDLHDNKRLVTASIPILLLFNVFLIMIILIIAPSLAYTFLKDPRSYLPIISIALVLPFDSISNLIRGYFFGKERMIPHVVSHILEQIIRLVLIIIITPQLLRINIIYAVCSLILVNVISEGFSILIFLFYLPRKLVIKKDDFKFNKPDFKNVMDIALPTTGGKLIGSLAFFLEPIIITSVLLSLGFSNNYIILEYGVIAGYVMPILVLPSFFTNAISSALLPVISRAYVKKQFSYVKSKIKQACFFSVLIGIPYTIIVFLFPEFLLNTLYRTTEGINYLKYSSLIFLLLYIQAPLAASLQSMNKAKNMMYDNVKGIVAKTIFLIALPFFNFKMGSLMIATSVSIVITTVCHYINVKKNLR